MMFIMSIMVMNEIKEKNDNEDKSREVEAGDENSGIRDACMLVCRGTGLDSNASLLRAPPCGANNQF